MTRKNKLKNSCKILFTILGLAAVVQSAITNLPKIEKKVSSSNEKELIQMTEKQVVRISSKDDSLSYIKLNVTENGNYLNFCDISDRHVNFQPLTPLSIYNQVKYNRHGFAKDQVGYTIAWNHLIPHVAFYQANIVHLDSEAMLRFIQVDPAKNTTNTIFTLRLEKKIIIGDMLVNPAFLVQVGGNLFLSYQTTENTIRILRIYNSKNQIYVKDVDNIVLSTELGDLTDMNSYLLPSGDFLLFILQDQKITSLYLDSNSQVLKNVVVVDNKIGKPEREYVEMRLWEDKDKTILNIYVLCSINGLYRFTYIYEGITREQAILSDSNFFIQIQNAESFNQYKGRNFFITTSQDVYQVREYEVVLGSNLNYYLNRVHEVDHKIRDIVVYDFFIIILGSNSHTISWHSVHPTLIMNMTQEQQYFSAFSLSGGSIVQLLNTTSMQNEPYFVGIQRYHVFLAKIVPVKPFISCDPQRAQVDIVGEHTIKIGFITQDWANSNSYQVQENSVEKILKINRVYADSMTAGAIAGIVISVVVVVIVIITCIFIRIKKQGKIKYTLQKEIESHTKRRNSFVPLNQINHTDATPNNKRQSSEVEFGAASEKIIQPPLHQFQRKDTQEHEDNQIIKFNEDEE